ncbi:hypothetical protein [uncultured Cohaesibacter sp.]|uniref:hypothetical protein n=1 Tax=uncultured Cohaesibacter sp. TaxID=1002546 RepID=UPI00292D8E9A|nr:hypothetical protein [uncultured Cohaesibacter sp.]
MSGFDSKETLRSNLILLGLVCLLAVWGVAIASWGYPAIIVPAVFLSFSSLIALVFVTRG